MYLNKAFVIGNLTRDPELRALPSGGNVASFSLATNRTWKNKDGSKGEQADFHNIVVFGNQGEMAAKYLKKGGSCLVEGRMQTRSWDGENGEKKYRTEIVADRVVFGPKRGDAQQDDGVDVPPPEEPAIVNSAPKKAPKSSIPTVNEIQYPEEDINVLDIPF